MNTEKPSTRVKKPSSHRNGLHILTYGEETTAKDVKDYFDNNHRNNLWVRIIGLNNLELLSEIARVFKIHTLTIEDLTNVQHQAKYEQDYGYSLYVLKTIRRGTDGDIHPAQFSMILGKSAIITFEEEESSNVNAYIEHLETERTPALIAYDMLDRIVDMYLCFSNEFTTEIEELEDTIVENMEKYNLSSLFEFKQKAHKFKRIIRPIRDIVDQIMRPKNEDFSPEMFPYLKDLWDHSIKAVNSADEILETANSLHSVIVTQLQYKLSRTMNLMTAVSVIFLPLMVITGIYGMNFDNMPELHYKFSYYIVLCIMAIVGLSMFTIFIKRKII